LRCNRLLQYFFNEVVGKKNKHKNRKAIWFEYINATVAQNFLISTSLFLVGYFRFLLLIASLKYYF